MLDISQRLLDLFGTERPVALVTGSGARRVGHTVAATLAARGYRLAIHAHRSLDEAQRTVEQLGVVGVEAIALQADLADDAQARSIVAQTCDAFGRIDLLVNSAAIWPRQKLEEITAADVRRSFDINTLATFVCAQQAGLTMAGQPTGGAIVNVGDWAVTRPYLDHAGYFASKGAIPTLTRTLAVELAERNPRIRVNAVLPGPVMLPADLPEDEREQVIRGTLVKREGSPQNVADAVVFLAENDFVTGVCLPVDGGRSVYAP